MPTQGKKGRVGPPTGSALLGGGVRMCRSQEEPGQGEGLLPLQDGSLHCLYGRPPSLPCSSPAAASLGIPAWVSTAQTRGKAGCPAGWGSLTASCSEALPLGEESRSRGSGPSDGSPG